MLVARLQDWARLEDWEQLQQIEELMRCEEHKNHTKPIFGQKNSWSLLHSISDCSATAPFIEGIHLVQFRKRHGHWNFSARLQSPDDPGPLGSWEMFSRFEPGGRKPWKRMGVEDVAQAKSSRGAMLWYAMQAVDCKLESIIFSFTSQGLQSLIFISKWPGLAASYCRLKTRVLELQDIHELLKLTSIALLGVCQTWS